MSSNTKNIFFVSTLEFTKLCASATDGLKSSLVWPVGIIIISEIWAISSVWLEACGLPSII